MRRARGRRDRRDSEAASVRRQAALFAIDVAIASGFALRAPGGGCLDILSPIGLAHEVREPIVRALTTYRRLVVGILEAADDGRGMAQVWVTPRRPGRLQ